MEIIQLPESMDFSLIPLKLGEYRAYLRSQRNKPKEFRAMPKPLQFDPQ